MFYKMFYKTFSSKFFIKVYTISKPKIEVIFIKAARWNFTSKMNFVKCAFPKDQIFNRTGLGRYFSNKGCLIWNHVINLFQIKITVYGIRKTKKHESKQKIIIYETVQQSKFIVYS